MSKPSESDIAKHAYHLWERAGRPHGRDKEHWHAAEREILGAATAKDDRPIGEIRSADQASTRPMGDPPSGRQAGAAAPSHQPHPASLGVTQAAAATARHVPQVRSEQPAGAPSQAQAGQPGGTRPQQSAAAKAAPPDSSPSRKPRSRSKQPSS